MKDIIRKAGEKAAIASLKAVEKAAPVAADVAVKTSKAAAKAGSNAVAKHKAKREEKDNAIINGLKQKYPGCRILLAKYDPYDADIFIHDPSLRKITAYEIYDEYFALQYSFEGILAKEFGRRRLHVYDKNRRKLGSGIERGLFRNSVSIENDGKQIMDVSQGFPAYEFSDIRYESIRDKESKGIIVGRSGCVLMETAHIKGYEVVAIVDPSRVASCMLIYAAMKLLSLPRPNPPGGE